MGFDFPEPPPYPGTEPLGMPQYTMTPELESDLPLTTLVSQLEHLTAIVKDLASRMDANERCRGDPHAAASPTSHSPTAALIPAAVAVPSLNLPPPTPPCSPNISGDEGELLDGDQLLQAAISSSCTPDVGHGAEILKGSFSLHTIEASKELSDKKVESGIERYKSHNRVDITMLSNKIDSYLLKEDEDGSIEEVKKVIPCVYVVWHVGNVLGIDHRSTFLDADARLIPSCIGFIDCLATPLPDTAGARRAHINCLKVDTAPLENIVSLSPNRLIKCKTWVLCI